MAAADAVYSTPEGAAAAEAVLTSASLMAKVLGDGRAAGILADADVANAAAVSRVWRRVARADALWLAALMREAPSLALLVDRFASPAGPGFCATLAQVKAAAARMAARPTPAAPARAWTLADFDVAMDFTTVRGEHVRSNMFRLGTGWPNFAGTISVDEDCGAGPDSVHRLRRQNEYDHRAYRLENGDLRVRLMLLRSDGALACLASQCKDVEFGRHRDSGLHCPSAFVTWRAGATPQELRLSLAPYVRGATMLEVCAMPQQGKGDPRYAKRHLLAWLTTAPLPWVAADSTLAEASHI